MLFPRPHPVARRTAGYAYTGSLGVNQIASIALADQTGRASPTSPARRTRSCSSRRRRDGKTLVGTDGRLRPAAGVRPGRSRPSRADQDDRRRQDGVRPGVHAGRDVRLGAGQEHERDRDRRHDDLDGGRRASRTTASSSRIRSCSRRTALTAFVTNNNKMDHMADPAHAGHAMPGMDGMASLVVVNVEDAQGREGDPARQEPDGHGHARARK